ncbi:MAG: radical SAM protein [Deltaproteobacteria bacterium]|nr:radical SAM protein [Deltaproteobacteria bacterium]
MKLALVAIHPEESARAVPLGPAMLASALKKAFPGEIRVDVLDLYLGDTAGQCAERILALRPRYVGFSMYLWNRLLVLQIAIIIKRKDPELIVLAGGPEATADYGRILEEPSLDLVLPGEGEEILVAVMGDLLRGARPRELRDSIRASPVRDLGALPSPFLDGTLEPSHYRGLLWELSRGCPFRCDFCFESRGAEGIRRIPLERVKAELLLFEASGVEQVFVLDPTFNYNQDEAKRVLRLIREHAPDVHFFFEVRSEFIDEEMATLFASIRCTLQIGLQSVHDAVLRNINRRIDPDAFEDKVLLLHEAGVTYGFDLIYGLPGDTLDGFYDSLDFALRLVPNHLDLFPLAVLPGTRLLETAPSFGLKYQEATPYRVISSPTFGAEDLEKAATTARSCDLFYNRGRAVPWFAMVVEALGLSASALFGSFAAHLDANPSEDVTSLHRDFLLSAFERQGNAVAGTIAADIVTYFGRSAELLESAPGTSEHAADGSVVVLDPRSCRASFAHDPVALLERLDAGFTDLDELALLLPERPCEAVLSVQEGLVDLEILSEQQQVRRHPAPS